MLAQRRKEERAAREKIVLWLQPLTTISYFCQNFIYLASSSLHKLARHKAFVALLCSLLLFFFLFLYMEGPHQSYLTPVRKQMFWCIYWLCLGVLSSVGLGTGLHTFVLYLGPHIASVTLAAYECNSLAFPEPPYPDDIICPEGDAPSGIVSFLQIMGKVRLEAMMWGAGTALGELPPYFMARAARLSGYDPNDEDELKEFEELRLKKIDPCDLTIITRLKLQIEGMVERVGFLAILACASIPNPLFDLAGITCGHFLVPFWTFFGATLLGKAVIKMHVQKMFVIIAFNEKLIEQLLMLVERIPYFGLKLQQPIKDFLQKQKLKLHRHSDPVASEGANIIAWVLEKLVIGMVIYFVVSIINSMAQSHHKRLCKNKRRPTLAKDLTARQFLNKDVKAS